MSKNKSTSIPVIILTLALLLAGAKFYPLYWFYFDGSLADNQKWFPSFYFFTYFLFKSFYPAIYALWLYFILPLDFKDQRY